MAIDVTTYMLARGYADGKIASLQPGSTEPTTITVEDIVGQIPSDELEKLLNSNSSIIILDGKYYRLARIEGNNLKYLNSTTNGEGQVANMSELNINKITGEFSTKQLVFASASVQYLEDALNEHKNDNNVHITATERNY